MLTTTPSHFLSLLSLLLLSSAFPPSLAWTCNGDEAATLVEIRRSLGNPLYLGSWNQSVDCCTWTGIWCDAMTGRVTELYLQSAHISGPIPPAVSRLASLRTLVISDSNVAGPIPPSIGNLTDLTTLNISRSPRVTGTIPKSLCNLRRLAELTLSDNGLSGSISDCFGKKLARIDLSRNQLSGPMPANFMLGVTATFPSPRLFLSHNRLTGPIPPSLADVPLKFIDLSHNMLAGDAGFLFREKGKLEEVYMRENELEFDLSSVKFPRRTKALDLMGNRIYGGIPQQMTKLKLLSLLNLSYNRLCGPIPTGGLMKNFDASSFEHNSCLCGGPLEPCTN